MPAKRGAKGWRETQPARETGWGEEALGAGPVGGVKGGLSARLSHSPPSSSRGRKEGGTEVGGVSGGAGEAGSGILDSETS